LQGITITEGGGGTEIKKIVFYVNNILLIKTFKKLCLTAFIDTCDPINTTGMSHMKVAGIYMNPTH